MTDLGECSFVGRDYCTHAWLTTRADGLETHDPDSSPDEQRLPVGMFACKYIEMNFGRPGRGDECAAEVVSDGVIVSIAGGICLMDMELDEFTK